MKISEIKQFIGSIAEVSGEDELDIRHLLTDSRQLKANGEWRMDEVLFFALKTAKNDGARYIPELRSKGVKAFVTGDALTALQPRRAHRGDHPPLPGRERAGDHAPDDVLPAHDRQGLHVQHPSLLLHLHRGTRIQMGARPRRTLRDEKAQ